jgi:uncharacterized protein involved in outer membrane biogenesis
MLTTSRRRRRWVLGLGLPLLLLAVILGGGWYWITYRLAPVVAARASSAIGRTVTIRRLHVGLGRITTAVATGVVVDNPKGWPADSAQLAVVPRLVVRFDLWRYLFHHQIEVESIALQRPRISMAELANHDTNYRLHTAGGGGAGTQIGALRIADGSIHVVLDPMRADVTIAVHTGAGHTGAGAGGGATNGAASQDGSPGIGPGKTLAWTPPKPGTPPRGSTTTASPGTSPKASGGAPARVASGAAAPPAGGPAAATAADSVLVADAHGTYAGQAIVGHLVGGSILALRSASQPWPIDLRVANGATKIHLHGSIADPLALAGARLRLALAGADLGSLSRLTGLSLPDTPPYSLAGALDFAPGKIALSDIQGRVGSSDLEGTLTIALGGPRPVLDANLQSRSVDLVDLGGFIGAKPGGSAATPNTAAAKPAPGLLPSTPINVPRFRNADVHLRYHAGQIQGRGMPLDNLVAALDIVDGKMTVHPVSFGVGTGRIAITATLDPTGKLLHTDARVDFQSLDVAKLMRATHTFTGAGTLSGSARLAGTGDSMAAIAAHGDGALLVGMAGGDLSALLVDLSGLEFGNAVLSALGVPKTTDVECMVGNFALQNGILRTRAFIIDTQQAIVGGTGTVNMGTNAVDLTLRTAPKHFSIGSLPGPIHITGTLTSPRILPGAQTVVRAGIAGALAAVFPPLAALPTIQFGTTDHHRCDALLAQARRAAPGTPPPATHPPAPHR